MHNTLVHIDKCNRVQSLFISSIPDFSFECIKFKSQNACCHFFVKRMGVVRYVRRRTHVALATVCRRLFGTAERTCLLGKPTTKGVIQPHV